ncbi:MAG: hypothetical protein GF411_08685 [Candidatus Lokiarchaeota archaeon]|nr:hypothetical protein [Candidatus Lokiarchaeota archaeon]
MEEGRYVKTVWGFNGPNKNLDIYELSDISILGIHGCVDGEIVDLSEPDAEVMIVFKDHVLSNEKIFRYFPEEDEFYEDQTKSIKATLHDADKETMRGRLSEITGLVPEDPIPPRNVMSEMISREIDEEIVEYIKVWKHNGEMIK